MVLAQRFYLVCAVMVAVAGLVGCGGGGGAGAPGDQTGTVRGTVTDAATHNPIPNATVSVDGTALVDSTDAQGGYEITGVPVGQRTIRATAAGYAEGTATADVQAGATVTVNLALTASGAPAGTVSGTVTVAGTGEPIANASVSVQGTGLTVTTDAEGRYTLANVPVGQQTIRAEASGYNPSTHTVTVQANATVTVNLTLTPAAGGHTYYVATTGDDRNPGTQQQPWRTPGYGSKQLRAGDTLVIMPGTYVMRAYYDDMITLEESGTPSAWITIRGSDPNNRPVLRGAGSLLAAIEIGQRAYVRIENLEITSELDTPYSGGLRTGIDGGGSSGSVQPTSYVEIRNVHAHHLEESCINFAGNISDVLIEDCNFHHTGYSLVAAPSAQGGPGWQRVTIRNCVFSRAGYFYQGREQESPYDRPDGIGMEPGVGPLEIAYCRFEHCLGDGLDSKTRQTYVHHTVIANNRADSLKLWGGGSRAENVLIYGDGDGVADNGPWGSVVISGEAGAHYELVNVTVDDNEARQNYPVYIQYDDPNPISVVFRNCIFSRGSNVFYLGPSVTLTAEHNLFYRSADTDLPVLYANGRNYYPADIPGLGVGNICADPLFVRRAWGSEGDYHLQPGSPAIDAGTAVGAPMTDLVGSPRPRGGGVDMGAYEM